ncbi:UvrD-helicase domain-containing protein [Natronosalvus vescus]|uniref:UvrD-helicase domain-containing protein n=1 Tax=Natronosalvus vescus TaxID=2953881 RepID=UPI002090432C|nr:UvrD-helicase domain-containing protein [Natronosalvus vescus]
MGEEGDRSQTPQGNQRAVIESDATCISVDAGAGTGKTTTMLMRIERALERGDVDPEEILVVTFANEAAANIRESIADRLEPAVAARIDVYTYHSLCYRLVREYAYYLGLSPSFEVVTERGRRRLLNRLLAERDYGFAAVDVAPGERATPATLARTVDEFVSVMSRENIDPDDLEAALPDERTLNFLDELLSMARREATASLSFDNEALRYFNRDEHLEAAREALVSYGTRLTFCREKIAESPASFREEPLVEEIDAYLRTVQACVTNVHGAMDLDDPTTKQLPRVLFANQIWGDRTKAIEQTPIGRLEHYVAFLRQAIHYTAIYADYRELLATEGAVDFDELVRTATRLVADPRVADEIVGRWTHVYCDEFQDTDATQWSLVTELTRGDDRPELLAIGDTDQAIYGWRGTDPRGLERVGADDPDHESIELEVNFRSRQEILDLTNHCSYGPQTSKTLREFGRIPGEYDESNPLHRVLKVESDDLAWSVPEQVGMTISRLLTDECARVPKRTVGDIAVIVRTNAQAQAITDELESRQIPYERAGSTVGSTAPGVQTIISYLRVLADPGAETHLRRVLLMRYRLSETDLTRLQTADTGLYEALRSVDIDTLENPSRVERARADLEALTAETDAYPLTQFLRRFRERTRLEWFLEPAARRAFDRIERFADTYDGNDVLGSLSTRFVDALERAVTGGSGDRQQGTTSEDAIDVMTVHQAKGLQYDTVLVPYCSDEEWCVRSDYAYSARYRLLTAMLDADEGSPSPLYADLATEPVAESWRVLHVALTRAENHLFVFGSEYDYEGGSDALGSSTAEACLPSSIEWSVTGERLDLWTTLTEAFERVEETYPETVVDVTDTLSATTQGPMGEVAYTDGDDERTLEATEAVGVIHRLGRLLRNGSLLSASDAAPSVSETPIPASRRTGALDRAAVRFSIDALFDPTGDSAPGALTHSYSALRTHGECPRKHYLEYVVGAPDDPVADDSSNGEGSADATDPTAPRQNARLVGTVFHAVAEESFHRGYTSQSEWENAARRQLAARGQHQHEPTVLACIDRYFEAGTPEIDAPVHEWPELAAEVSFTVDDVPGVDGSVVGAIDTVRRTPDGDLVVLDYKATGERIDPDSAVQLSLYARAYERQFGEAVDAVGYVYVGPVDGSRPRVDLRQSTVVPAWESVRDALEALDQPGYAETTPGSHCQYCAHRSLGCGPDHLE